jgi:hypothetical protein
MICRHTKFHVPGSTLSLVTSIKLKVYHRRHVILRPTKILPQDKLRISVRHITVHHLRAIKDMPLVSRHLTGYYNLLKKITTRLRVFE